MGSSNLAIPDYASPVVLFGKKDGRKCMGCDYRHLNTQIVLYNFPLPNIDDVIDILQGATVFTTLCLRNGVFHAPVHISALKKYTAFVTYNGQYEFQYVLFSISNSPAGFLRFISAVFRDLI